MNRSLTSILTILTIFIGFLFFQVLIFESSLQLILLGLFIGGVSFGLFSYSLRNFSWEELGIVKGDWKKQIVYGVLVGLILYAAFFIYSYVSSGFQEIVFLQPSVDYVEISVVFAIVVSEEFFFRGYAISLLERQINTKASCIISSIFFALYHQSTVIKNLMGFSSMDVYLNYEYVLMLFLGSLLLSFFFVKKRSLIMPITVHLTWNLLILSGTPFEGLPIFP